MCRHPFQVVIFPDILYTVPMNKLLSIPAAAFVIFNLCAAPVLSEEFKMTDFTADSSHVMPVGRTQFDNGTLWMAFSGSGASFTITAKKLIVTLAGDSGARVRKAGENTNLARVAIYVNGQRTIDELLLKQEQTYTVFEGSTQQTAAVNIIKLSEAALSLAGIKNISADEGAVIIPAEAKPRRIEIIGDSITCGYGVDDENCSHHFSTATEDVTKSYSYKMAQALDADYSMVSISGWGIISGWTGDGTKKSDQQLPPYYEKFGFSYNTFADGKQAQTTNWDFSRFVPDVIVINLGTNDDSYCNGQQEREKDYANQYVNFLKTVRRNNPHAHIICSLGIMGDRLYPEIQKAVINYINETEDANINTFRFNPQIAADGYAADWHPTEKTHTKAAAALTSEIKTIMKW
jgi:lysophospholipase L1-like esterase